MFAGVAGWMGLWIKSSVIMYTYILRFIDDVKDIKKKREENGCCQYRMTLLYQNFA